MLTVLNQHSKWLSCTLFAIVTILKSINGDTDTCDNIPEIENAAPRGDTAPPFAIGRVITYSCKPGFHATQGAVSATCRLEDGSATWVHSQSKCRHKTCGHPGEVENAKRTGEDFRFSKSVIYECYPGYEMRGRPQLYCDVNGEWTPNVPRCIIISCRNPSKPANGSVTYNSVTYQSIATYTCDNSFLFVGTTDSTIKRECLANKTWSGIMPECKEALCSDPHTDPGVVITDMSHDKRYHVGKRVYYSCTNNDKQLPILIQCTRYGNWTIEPRCDTAAVPTNATPTTLSPPPQSFTDADIKMPCGKPPLIEHGTVTDLQLQSVKYKCESGFSLKGQEVLTCLPSGKWNADPPSCELGKKKLPVGLIVGIVVGIVALIGIIVGGVVLFHKKRKSSIPGNKKKASPNDAVNMDEVQSLEKNNKPIPVTVL